jgi:OmpA-OmpF porin, OOP family
MWYHSRTLLVGFALLATAGLPQLAEAQIGNRVRDTARRAAERETLRQVDRQVTQAVRCVLTDQACIDKAKAEGKEVQVVDAQGNAVSASAPASTAAQRVGEGAWANYDFVPGERVLFADDFSGDRVGNFPRRLEFVNGTMEIVEMHGGRYLRATSDARFEIILPESLPERFTIEFEAHLPHWWHQLFVAVGEPAGGYRGIRAVYQRLDRYPFSYVQLSKQFQSGIAGPDGGKALTRYEPLHERIVPVRIMADGSYVKVFLDERRIANVPNANLQRSGRIGVFITGEVREDRPVFVGNFRIAAGGPSLYDALQADGRVTTQGILFDTGSDRLRPESTPTLKEIGDMLRQHGSLRLRIEGHTDNVGQAAANQALSEKRAAAVRQHLVSSYGIDAGRLEAVGKGQTEPAAGNDTPEGRQNNRRVVLVRL